MDNTNNTSNDHTAPMSLYNEVNGIGRVVRVVHVECFKLESDIRVTPLAMKWLVATTTTAKRVN
jgi:hypothetical protein